MNGEMLVEHIKKMAENPAVLELLTAHGFDVNAKNKDGATPLHLAVEGNNAEELVSLLLELGADAYAVNKAGKKPADLAQETGNQRLVALLTGTQTSQGSTKR